MDSSEPSVCVCIPTYNEAGTIGEVISRIQGLEGLRKTIVVVDITAATAPLRSSGA